MIVKYNSLNAVYPALPFPVDFGFDKRFTHAIRRVHIRRMCVDRALMHWAVNNQFWLLPELINVNHQNGRRISW
jgi:hypothetical protein